MNRRVFDAFRREAAGVSRRASLLTLGGVALAAGLRNAGVSESKKKKKGQDCKKKEKQRCSNDAAACRATIEAACQDPEGCTELLLCCDECSANGFLTCFLAELSEMTS